MAKEKPGLNVAFVGHVDHGKSTTIGRLMFDSGNLPAQELEKLKKMAQEKGKVGFEFAYVMDKFKEERERGVTIDLSYQKVITNKREVTIIDAPGHKDFVKNMITGASQADAAFLVVAAKEGVQPQTKEHLWLLKTMGVGDICILVNKMDTVEYKEDAFNKVKEGLGTLLKTAGYKPEEMTFIAASGFMGDNVFNKSDKMAWYKGPTVYEQLDLFKDPDKATDLPMRMPLQDVYDITGIGTVPVGKIISGVMKIGQKVVVLPGRSGTGVNGEVRSIEAHHEQLQEAEAGDNVGINIRGVGKKDVARGDVVCDVTKPAKIVDEFTAQVVVINHPTVIAKGYTPVFHVHTAQVPCQFIELIEVARGGQKIENPDFLKTGDVAKVKIKPIGNLVLETNSDNPHMARFAIRDAGATVGAGVCIELKAK
ncbi:translation elongation factor EF-1 subunit alpha [Candidatus Pacearchaeota archaeon CG10_big_fil_rev_8_21_14_0_10_35_219]|nr:translation elongation factor EF-1 subunit alpha [Candidatus Pacearchaeota archaeon]OIO43310.1 MAG: translation elongation factor EF-1 subunit alpha [Candidatus Pacearchaeota archaeon CG1_02_35_32]PIO07760.1 MAG: translation elongation factor EF-1 subunit alpha [Candidatus Pacearchaeota archaeon CG10_big_fil_rev_8_21_14_0_10_35_219]PIY81458.1 MAG: translation elongation factor EF-1 subunit alpha [Candidatus Pacearchaeota archaeon CG_4_10_14_0_8_um_filter_35_169]PIZ80456.1 MAG: translation el